MALTEEQVREVRKVAGRITAQNLRKRRNAIVAGFLILFTGLLLAVTNTQRFRAESREAIVASGRVVAVQECNQSYILNDTIRGIFVRLKQNTALNYKNNTIPESQYRQTVAYYDSELKKFTPIDCRQALKLTDDSDKKLRVPEPYYPGNPNNPSP